MRLTIMIASILALGAASSVTAAVDAAAGQAVFTKKCKTCHGATGQGNPGMAKALKVDIRDLGSAEV